MTLTKTIRNDIFSIDLFMENKNYDVLCFLSKLSGRASEWEVKSFDILYIFVPIIILIYCSYLHFFFYT